MEALVTGFFIGLCIAFVVTVLIVVGAVKKHRGKGVGTPKRDKMGRFKRSS